MYKVKWEKEALESLAEIGLTGKKIKIRVENHLTKNPTEFGKTLKDKLKGLWSYRCFDKYRVIYQIFKNELLIYSGRSWFTEKCLPKLSRKL